MSKWRMCKGDHVYSRYFIPNIEYESKGYADYICLNFWKWYVGFVRHYKGMHVSK